MVGSPSVSVHLLLVAAVLLALASGANDGAAILAANLGGQGLSPLRALVLLCAVVIVGPFIFGTAVATTVAHGLVSFSGADGVNALTVAVMAAVMVAFGASRLGLPTSITQGLLGGIVGAGLGFGSQVDWGTVLRVLVLFVAAPFVAGTVAGLIAIGIAWLPHRGEVGAHLRRLHGGAYVAQCAAYAANDAQKLVAVFAIARGAYGTPGAVLPSLTSQIIIGLLFAIGTLIGVSRVGGRMSRKLIVAGPLTASAADLGSAVAVLGSSLLGSPVSTPQAASAGLIGSTMAAAGHRAVRWNQALSLGVVWITTLPAAVALAAIGGLLLRG